MKKNNFTVHEKKLIAGISMVMGMRMLGVSMIIPVFSIFATGMPGSSKTLAGLAAGIFGIVQILLLVPVGRMSDRWGRKRVTLAGLVVYFLGMVLSGLSRTIHQLIGARVIAGAGAINGVTMAWLSDGVDERRRTSALSWVGISMGTAVIFGFTLSPVIAAMIGMSYLFFICAFMVLATIVFTACYLDEHDCDEADPVELRTESVTNILRNPDMKRLNIAGLVGNLALNSVFFVMPLMLEKETGLGGMWKIYVPMALLGTACMFYFGNRADRSSSRSVAIIGMLFEIAGMFPVMFSESFVACVASFMLFYCGHCILSPVLPAAVSRYPNTQLRGTVLSVFNSSQFLGSGIGGLLSGILMEFSHRAIFIALFVLLVAGLAAISGLGDFRSGENGRSA